MSSNIEQIVKIIVPILKKHDVEFAGVFGSLARGEERPDSDVDLIIRYSPQMEEKAGLFEFVGLQQEISKIMYIMGL